MMNLEILIYDTKRLKFTIYVEILDGLLDDTPKKIEFRHLYRNDYAVRQLTNFLI